MQKSGTTALDAYLRLHPQISMARVKEPHYFDDDDIDWLSPNYAAYHRQFDLSLGEDVVLGEATPILTFWPHALERIAAYNRKARLLICVRHPAFRAFSHWRMEHFRGSETRTFARSIAEPLATGLANEALRKHSYVERGLYAPQIERAQNLFSEKRVLVLRTDHLWLYPKKSLRTVCDFLKIDAFAKQMKMGSYTASIDTRSRLAIADVERLALVRLYAKDIRRTSELTGIHLDDWLDPAYREPMPTGPDA